MQQILQQNKYVARGLKSCFKFFIFADDDEEDAVHMLMDSPQCVIFGMFMIW